MLCMKKRFRVTIERIEAHYKVRRDGVSRGFRIVVSIVLSYILFSVIASIFNLSEIVRYVLIGTVSLGVAAIVSSKPRLVLTVVCVMLSFIGFMFVAVSFDKENIAEIGWEPSLLGAGVSLLAIAIALYALMRSTGREDDVLDSKRSGREVDSVGSEEGYAWIQEVRKYRCEYCRSLGKYSYCKTLVGMKRHIMSKHM